MNPYRQPLALLLASALLTIVSSVSGAQPKEARGYIGASIGITNGTPVIVGRMSESMPAFKAGLRLGDKILTIDGKSTDKLELPEIINLISGVAGTKVALTILTFAGERKKVTLKRAIPTPEFTQETARREDERRKAHFAHFKEMAQAWRASKPKFPEDTQKQRILAENAVLENRFADAQTHYLKGLSACDQLWPSGLYNIAMLCAEEQQYYGAADWMKYYVELVPDAPDAKAMRANIIIWEDKWTRLHPAPK